MYGTCKMQVAQIRTLLVLAAIFFCQLTFTPAEAYPSSCFECEEEVWEEVPCDEIPSNSTTIVPPAYTYPTTTSYSTARPETSTTATTPTTTTISTTTPYPLTTTTTPSHDPYKKCYCECKNGCKDFCRKVVVNPQSKSQIIQITEVSQPLPQGRLESTYYHSSKLVPPASDPKPYQPPSYGYPSKYESPPSVQVQKPVAEVYNSVPYYRSSPVASHGYNRDFNSAHNEKKYLPDLSYRNKHETYYFSSPETELSDLPSYFQNLYSRAVFDLEADNFQANTIPKLPEYSQYPCQGTGTFSSPVPVDSVAYSDKFYDSLYGNSESYAYYDDFGTISETPHHSLLYK
ncbi:uncharacterized protein LOC101899429 [Musca domestica]|uniref:Uncharacterized protein LOC101899429 n=2 Tax=Musca domestica TaxID=7370 RepID=A0A9J7CXG3_MUSDO|nr:uncharacterized protein LOC101899429 [Musca domestica]